MKDTATGHANSQLNEEEAIRRAQRGDAVAFEYLYKSHSKHVYSGCMRMLKNVSDAEDLTQQVFLRVFRKIGTFRGESEFSTWLHRITINAVLMHLRRKKSTEARTEDVGSALANGEASGELAADDVSLLGAIDRLNLRRALHKLPSGYRQFFLLHDVIGYKHAEIAGILRCSAGCSKSQLHRARKRLRDLLHGKTWEREAEVVALLEASH